MQKLILAHVPGDEAVAQRLCAIMGGVPVPVRHAGSAIQVGAGGVLGVVWSAKAAASPAGTRLAELAAAAPSAILLHADGTPASDALAAQDLITATADAREEDLLSKLRLAQKVQPRRAVQARPRRDHVAPALTPRAEPAETKGTYSRMFMGGMTRGFASSVAVLSLGAGAAVGVQERAGVLGIADSFAHPFEPGKAHVALAGVTQELEEDGLAGLISNDELVRQASALRQAAAVQRAQISQQLDVAEHVLADARVRTDGMIARLEAMSAQGDRFSFAAAAPQAVRPAQPAPLAVEAAPPQLTEAPAAAQAAAPQAADSVVSGQQASLPPDDAYALTRYVDRLADTGSKPFEPSKLGLWSPT